MAENYGFALEKQRAVERMRELNARARYRQSTAPKIPTQSEFRREESRKDAAGGSTFLSDFNIPFLNNLGTDPDMALILGLVLILTAERSDKLLLLALLYILI